MYRLKNFQVPKKKFFRFLQPTKNSKTIWTKINKLTTLPKRSWRKCLRASADKKLQLQRIPKQKMHQKYEKSQKYQKQKTKGEKNKNNYRHKFFLDSGIGVFELNEQI